MQDPDRPTDKAGALIYLKAKKVALLELGGEICRNDMKTGSEISTLVFAKVKLLDEELEGY